MDDVGWFYTVKRFFIELLARLLPRSVRAEVFWNFAQDAGDELGKDVFNRLTVMEVWNRKLAVLEGE